MAIEILAPAGDEQSFISAISAGANAIYLGLKEFSARKSAENFCVENLDFYLSYAHLFNVKVYVAVNTLIKDCEMDSFLSLISEAQAKGVDAFILQDMFLGREIKNALPEICLHLSTQAGVCNSLGASLAKEYGFDRVILARETLLEDIKAIAKIIETEVFVQGALCTAFSGHCYMSSFIGGNSGNRGYCKQPCRKQYTYSGEGFAPFKGYNLSLKDLCLKDKVEALKNAGVSSFKIEGRMRSPEYVYSAVSVYRDALKGKFDANNFSNLKASFNRGDYTEGYLDGCTRGIISDKIQGNIGDFVGFVKSCGKGWASIETPKVFTKGDGFKIIRNGYEVGNGIFESAINKGFKISATGNFKIGDRVHITKDKSLSEEVLNLKPLAEISVSVSFEENKKAKAEISCGNREFVIFSDEEFSVADNSPIKNKDVLDTFLKVDSYPFNPTIYVKIEGNVFAPKSKLNAFRRKCYKVAIEAFSGAREFRKIELSVNDVCFITDITVEKNAVILSDFVGFESDCNTLAIFKPIDYSDFSAMDTFVQKFSYTNSLLYLPPYASNKDLRTLFKAVEKFGGVYTEGYYGISVAKLKRKNLFCGTGINIFNSIDAKSVRLLKNFSNFAYSKELSLNEVDSIARYGVVLTRGCLQVMDLLYCPFSSNCKSCNRKDVYSLVDCDGREYKVRRYKLNGCRFEVYNPYDLVYNYNGQNLFDFTLYNAEKANAIFKAKNNTEIFSIISNHTKGNLNKGIK